MVKVTFNSALAQKELKKGEKDEALIPQEGVSSLYKRQQDLFVLDTVITLGTRFPGMRRVLKPKNKLLN